MKLTEQQLQKMFRNSRNVDNDTQDFDLHGSVAASDNRLTDVERIADDSTLSATYHVMNQLHEWSTAIENDIKLSLKPPLFETMLNWLKPSLTAAAVVTAVYFIVPEMNQTPHIHSVAQGDEIMFNASFEGHNDVITNLSFDQQPANKSDRISLKGFG